MTAGPSDDHEPGRGTLRVLAGVAGLAFLLVALACTAVLVFAWFVAGQVPNAQDVTGEWASTPNSWTQTFELVGIATMIGLITGGFAVATVALLGVAFWNRRPGRRALLAVLLGPAALTLAVVGTALAVQSGDALPATDCQEFRFDRAALASADRAEWEEQARGLVDCRDLIDARASEVRRRLGAQPSLRQDGENLSLHGGAFVVRIADGRVYDLTYDDDLADRAG